MAARSDDCAHRVDGLFVPRDCAHKIHRLCETICDARTPTFDHQLMLGYHIPLGYFVLTLVTLFDPDGRIMEAMVARFEVDTPFNKMEERESLLHATPFGEKDNGSNGMDRDGVKPGLG